LFVAAPPQLEPQEHVIESSKNSKATSLDGSNFEQSTSNYQVFLN